MASLVEIANQALLMLGQKQIISLTEDSTAARYCNGRLPYIRDTVLRAYPWNSAIRRATLAQSSDTPAWGYDYQYALPTDPLCLRVLEMKECSDGGMDWKVEGRYILTDSQTCNIKYIAQITDPNEMEVLLREAIAAALAADGCFSITGSTAQQEAMLKIYEKKISEARSADAQEGNPDTLIDDTFLDARL